MKARARKAAAMASSLDPFVDAIIAPARRAVNTQFPWPCPQRLELTGSKLFKHSQKKGISMTSKKITRQDLSHAADKYKNWGKWGPNDEIGTLNYTRPEDIIAAARLARKGKVLLLARNFNHTGPQRPKCKYHAMRATNPIHTMIGIGTDAYSGVLDKRGIRAADDMVTMPLQCGTQWDGLGHVFYESHMWNGYDCREVTSAGAQKCGIEKTKNKMVGR